MIGDTFSLTFGFINGKLTFRHWDSDLTSSDINIISLYRKIKCQFAECRFTKRDKKQVFGFLSFYMNCFWKSKVWRRAEALSACNENHKINTMTWCIGAYRLFFSTGTESWRLVYSSWVRVAIMWWVSGTEVLCSSNIDNGQPAANKNQSCSYSFVDTCKGIQTYFALWRFWSILWRNWAETYLLHLKMSTRGPHCTISFRQQLSFAPFNQAWFNFDPFHLYYHVTGRPVMFTWQASDFPSNPVIQNIVTAWLN